MSLVLSAVEEQIVIAACSGVLLDLSPELPRSTRPAEAAMQDWGDDKTVRARVLRDLLRGLHPGTGDPIDLDPRGIIIRGALISGALDLDNLQTATPLKLTLCSLPAPISARGATLGPLAFNRCSLTGHPLPLVLTSTHVIGPVVMRGAEIRNDTGPALSADRLTADDSLFLDDGFRATGSGELGAVRLLGAHVGGQFALSGAKIHNDIGPALSADGLTVDSDLYLDAGFGATGSGEEGAVRLLGAHVGGQFALSGAEIRNDTGPALSADGLAVDGGVFLDDGFRATGSGEFGAVRLPGAHVGGQFLLSGAKIHNDTGPAFNADRLTADGNLFLHDQFSATGSGELGAVRLPGAHVGGQLSLSGAEIRNDTGPALSADRLTVDRHLFLNAGFSATGSDEDGAVRLLGAHVGGQFSLSGAELHNDIGPAFIADGLTVNNDLVLNVGFSATGSDGAGAVHLIGARVGGQLFVDPSVVAAPDTQGQSWRVDDLTYRGVPSCGVAPWLSLLRSGTPRYTPQGYRQLAAAAAAQGHDDEVRQILIAQRRDQLARGDLGGGRRAWARFTDFSLGFGYQPWRALLGIVLSVVIALLLTLWVWRGAFDMPSPEQSGDRVACSSAELVGIALDASLPLVTAPWAGDCVPDDNIGGNMWRATSLGIQLLSWASATLFVAGFTNVVRKT